MENELIIAYAFSGMFSSLFCIYCWHKLLGIKLKWWDFRFYFALLLLIIFGTVINFCLPQYAKIFFMIILLIGVNYIFFCKDIIKGTIAVVVSELIVMICETLFVLLMFPFYGNEVARLQSTPLGVLIINVLIAVFSFLSLKLSIVYKSYNLLLKTFNNLHNNMLVFTTIITILVASLFMIMSWVDLPIYITLFFNTVLVIFYIGIVIKLVNTKVNYDKINGKYEMSLVSLREYENIMDQYRITNHENKNQLLTIRNMVKAKDKKLTKYIDTVIEDKIKDNENIFYKTSKIPEGGLRATIYSKLCQIKELEINYVLDISNDVCTVDLINMDDVTVLNVCKIIGVFLDNAIEEVKNLKSKKIDIDIFVMDNKLCIDISNNFGNNLDLSKIDKMGYTTKGSGHGYGLSLVNRILKDDNNLENEKMINHDMFLQRLKIRL